MPIHIRFSSRAQVWLDDHPADWIRGWLFELADGAVDLGDPLPGFQPDVYSCLVMSPDGVLLGVVLASFGDTLTVLKFDDLTSEG